MAATAVLIENEVVRLIAAAGIDGLTAGSVFPRELPERLDRDPSPCCVVVVGNERPASDVKTNTSVVLDYPVLVVLAKKVALTQPRSDPWKKDARYRLWNLLWRGFLLGTSGVVRRCEYNPEPDFTPVGFTQDFKVSAQLFVYRTEEPKPASGVVS